MKRSRRLPAKRARNSSRWPSRMSNRLGTTPDSWNWRSQLSGSEGFTGMTCIGASQSLAAATVPECVPAQLADVELAAHLAHFGMTRVADVRVVRPHHGFAVLPLRVQQQPERV